MSFIEAKQVNNHTPPHPKIKNILVIGSGKGGVGKSTISVQMALHLQHMGFQIGLLDCDIYGPSIPTLMGLSDQGPPKINDKQQMIPPLSQNIPVMSIGFLVEPKTPIIWRGPMVSQAVDQLLNQTDWPNPLDLLIIDLPPGTGDIHLSLCQKVPIIAAIVVSTSQEVALSDARRACTMFQKLNIPLLGIIENMATYTCQQCGHTEHLFGQEGAFALAKSLDTTLLGSLPFNLDLMQSHNQAANHVSPFITHPSFMVCMESVLANLQQLPKRQDASLASIPVIHTKS
jgi:ATP-binding protein involved in chromosome partitioning